MSQSEPIPTPTPTPPPIDPAALADLLARVLAQSGPTPLPLAEWCDQIMADYTRPARARGTCLRMRQALRELVELAGPGATLRDLTPALLTAFAHAHPDRASTTQDGLTACLKTAANRAVLAGLMPSSPFRGRSFPAPRRGGRTAPRHHPAAAIARVLADLATRAQAGEWRDWRLYALAATVAYTGLRKNEALGLLVADVDLDGGFVWVRPNRFRGLKTRGSEAPVPIPEALAPILRQWVARVGSPCLFPNRDRRSPWFGGDLKGRALEALKAAGRRVGVQGFGFLALRHSLASHLAGRHKLGEKQIQLLLRHTVRRTQDHYVHPDRVNLRESVRDFDYAPAPDPTPAPPTRPESSRADRAHVLPRRTFRRRPSRRYADA